MPTLAKADDDEEAEKEISSEKYRGTLLQPGEKPPFGLTRQAFDELCSLPTIDFACKVISITLDYYESLPCPAKLSNGAPNVWKMSVFVADGDPLEAATRSTAALTSTFTLWDEERDTYYGAPTSASVLVASSPFYVDMVDGAPSIDVIGIIGCLNTVAIPSAFGRGFSKKNRKLWKKDDLPILYSGSYGNLPEHFRPFKLIVHDATLQSGLTTFQIPPAAANTQSVSKAKDASGNPNVVAAVQVTCPKLAKGWNQARLICICAYCRNMGCCKSGPGEMKVMRRCSACRTSY